MNGAPAVRLSVVIPVRNGAAHLAALLDSLAGQIGPGIEAICVDDASSDATAAIAAGYPWLRLVRRAARGGAGAARNSGAAAARGEILAFLDADTRLADPDYLARCLAFFDARPDCAAVSGCYHDRNPRRHRFARFLDAYEASLREGALEAFAPGSLSGGVCAVRRSAFAAVGGFDEDPRVAVEDADLGCRLARDGHRHWATGELRVEHAQPGLGHYLRELLPRTRYYLHMLRHYRAFIEIMGGPGEGLRRAVAALLLAALPFAGTAAGFAAGAALAALLAATNAPLWRRLVRSEGLTFLPYGLFAYLATTVPIVAGGALALADMLRFVLARRRVDAAVLWAYLKSLASRRSPGYLILFVTHRCNARCGHCFDDAQRQSIGRADELSLARIRRLAPTLGPVGHLSLTGGEPFLREDLPEIVETLYRDGGVRSFSLITNGSFPERVAEQVPRMLAAAPRARFMVTLSVDGLGAEHDRLRGTPGLFAKGEASLRQLERLRRWWPQLHLHSCTTLFEANRASLAGTVQHLAGRRFDQIQLNYLRGSTADPACRPVSFHEYDRARRLVEAANRGPRETWGLAEVFRVLDRALFEVVRRPDEPWACGGCVAGRKLAVIQANGDVLPCEMLRSVQPQRAAEHGNFVMGNLAGHGDDLAAVLASPAAGRIRAMIRDTGCRCSFECAVMATLVYRPWRLPAVFLRRRRGVAGQPAPAGRRAS